jgi:hypothetical protein
MNAIIRTRYFLKNEEAVSEEFTVLPALSVVMIGFALFVLLVAQTYDAYTDRIDRLQTYQIVEGFFQKILNPDCFFIKPPCVVDLRLLQNDTSSLQRYVEQYTRSGLNYYLLIQWDNQTWCSLEDIETHSLNYVAVSKPIGIYLNEAQTVLGTVTLSLWR